MNLMVIVTVKYNLKREVTKILVKVRWVCSKGT